MPWNHTVRGQLGSLEDGAGGHGGLAVAAIALLRSKRLARRPASKLCLWLAWTTYLTTTTLRRSHRYSPNNADRRVILPILVDDGERLCNKLSKRFGLSREQWTALAAQAMRVETPEPGDLTEQ